jgi:hypothetical protein
MVEKSEINQHILRNYNNKKAVLKGPVFYYALKVD